MTTRKQTAALALTGAVALASGAYALGTHSDGDAVASGSSDRPAAAHFGPGRGGPFGPEGLADRLGVEADELREAIEDIRKDLPRLEDRRDGFAQELADALGTTREKVQDALEKVHEAQMREHEQRFEDFAEKLAQRLNLDVSKVKEALETPRMFHWRPGP